MRRFSVEVRETIRGFMQALACPGFGGVGRTGFSCCGDR
jgi:hypothetical protein